MKSKLIALLLGLSLSAQLFATGVEGPINGSSTPNVANATGTLPVANGGTNVTSATDDSVLLGNGTTFQLKAIPNCLDTLGTHLNYTASTNTWSCGTSSDVATSVTGTLPILNGGTNVTTATDDNVLIGNGTTFQLKAVTNCVDTGGNHLNYTASSNTISCGTSGGGATATTGTFTGTVTGCTTADTVAMAYVKVGDTVSLHPAGGVSVSCTSNATTFTVTGLPAAVRPTTTSKVVPVVVVNSGTSQVGTGTVDTSGILTFSMPASALSTTGFTASGSKGFPNSFNMTYTVDATNP